MVQRGSHRWLRTRGYRLTSRLMGTGRMDARKIRVRGVGTRDRPNDNRRRSRPAEGCRGMPPDVAEGDGCACRRKGYGRSAATVEGTDGNTAVRRSPAGVKAVSG